MKKITLLLILFFAVKNYSQTKGITYQAVLLNPSINQTKDANQDLPLMNKDICMQFKFVDEFSNIEYLEVVQTKTDQYGMVNLVIGKGLQTGGYASSFENISWTELSKKLSVGVNVDGSCSSFVEISNQEFNYVPYAFSAINAENVTGVVAIENGGTNATTVLGARTNLQINNVDNTSDLNKPLSSATQTALSLKENLANKSSNVAADGTSDTKYPSVKSVKIYVDANAASATTALTNEISRATTSENTIAANLVTETNNRTAANNTLTTNLATEVTNRTAADLLKEDLANKSTSVITDGTSDTKYPSVKSVKTYVDAAATTASTALTNEISRATAAENTIATNLATETSTRTSADNMLTTNLTAETSARTSADVTLTTNLATEVTNRTAADLLKEDVVNKSTNVTTDGASDSKYPSVKSVKIYVDAASVSATTALTNEVTRATAAENTIATNLTTETTARTSADATLTTNLATEVNNRTAADLLKEDVANKTTNVTTDGASDSKFPSVKSVKTYVDAAATFASTALANEVSRATIAENAIAANLVTETNNRTAANNTLTTNLSTETSARTSADGTLQTNINAVQADVDANEAAANTALNLKANLASPTFTGTVSGIDKTMVGLENVDNTTDASKPVSLATQTALNFKVDKVSGKGLSTEDYTTAEKTKLAAITGTNTGDQDISGIAVNATKIGDLTSLTTTAKSNLVAAVNEIQAGKASLVSPTFTGTVSGITKSMVGLGNVD
ncbi:MAG TPA: hypothetical protein VL859_06210, partial [Flavobacterium sp.]|nr:hypothetical protein [Flavobacterium sp.]